MSKDELLPGIVRGKDALIVELPACTVMIDQGQFREFDLDGINVGEPRPATWPEFEMMKRILDLEKAVVAVAVVVASTTLKK